MPRQEKHAGCQGLEWFEDTEIPVKFASTDLGFHPEIW